MWYVYNYKLRNLMIVDRNSDFQYAALLATPGPAVRIPSECFEDLGSYARQDPSTLPSEPHSRAS